MRKPSARLSIIIVNWNTRDLLLQCLESIEQDTLGLNVETIVVDNASSDDSVKLVRERFPRISLIENSENLGFARANNQAIQHSEGKYALLLNSDTKVLAGALETLCTFMDSHPEAGAAGAHLLNADGTLQPSCHPMLTPEREFWRLALLEALWPRMNYPLQAWESMGRARQVEVIKGACLLLRREALDQVGLLDERYFMYTEEVDLCYRLDEAGWEIWWVPQARVVHYGEASSRQAAEAMYIELYRSKIQFYRKHGGERRANRFKTYLYFAYWPRLIMAFLVGWFNRSLLEQGAKWRQLLTELPAL